MMKQKYYLILGIVAVLGIILIAGCVQHPSGERMFVEASIVPQTYEWSNLQGRPIQYGFIYNQELDVNFTATKYMGNTDGLMDIQISLPKEFELLEGDTEWRGNDVSKTLNLKLNPSEKGRYEIEMIATNTANNFTVSGKIIVCVGEDIEEITSYCLQEIESLPSPEQITED